MHIEPEIRICNLCHSGSPDDTAAGGFAAVDVGAVPVEGAGTDVAEVGDVGAAEVAGNGCAVEVTGDVCGVELAGDICAVEVAGDDFAVEFVGCDSGWLVFEGTGETVWADLGVNAVTGGLELGATRLELAAACGEGGVAGPKLVAA